MSISIKKKKKKAQKFSKLLWFSTSALSGKWLEMFSHFNVSTGKARELRVERDCCNRQTQPPVQGSFCKPVSNIPENGRPLAELTSSETTEGEERSKKEDEEGNKRKKRERKNIGKEKKRRNIQVNNNNNNHQK